MGACDVGPAPAGCPSVAEPFSPVGTSSFVDLLEMLGRVRVEPDLAMLLGWVGGVSCLPVGSGDPSPRSRLRDYRRRSQARSAANTTPPATLVGVATPTSFSVPPASAVAEWSLSERGETVPSGFSLDGPSELAIIHPPL